MIVTRAPLRVSFMGGGTDLPAFYRQEEGCVLSTSIQRYVYICLNKKFDDSIRVSYSQNEFCNSVDEIKHDLVRESLRFMGVEKGVEITSVSDIPSNGSGMGSSSAFTVALLTALAEYTKRGWTKEWLASTACDIEINCCGKPIGKQDQYASAIGGMNFIRFKPNESVESSPLWIRGAVRRELGRKLLLLHTGQSRKAEAILAAQSAHTGNDPETRRRLREMVILAQVMRDQIEAGNLSDFGRLLNAGWQLKQNLAGGIRDTFIDHCWTMGMQNGAEGCKLLGAGGGGFMLFYAEPDAQERIKQALPDLRPLPFDFDWDGASCKMR